jgi:UDP-glucose 4-epimerase
VVVAEDWLKVLPNLLADADDLIYCVGSASPTEAEVDPARDISTVLPPLVRVLDLLRLHPSTRLTFLSSGGTVYGDVTELPISEQAPTRPISSYGCLKLACENYIHMYAQLHDVDARILRVANPYGPTQDASAGQGLVARLFGNAMSGEAVVLFGGGKAVRDYLHVDDLACAIAGSLGIDRLQAVLNVGSGVGHSSLEVVQLVAKVTGVSFDIRLHPPRGYDVHANVLDVSLAKGALGYTTRALEEGLRDTWAVLQQMGASVSRAMPRPLRRIDGA